MLDEDITWFVQTFKCCLREPLLDAPKHSSLVSSIASHAARAAQRLCVRPLATGLRPTAFRACETNSLRNVVQYIIL